MSHVAGTNTVEFPLKGAPTAIDAVYRSCPIDSAVNSAPLPFRTPLNVST